MEPIPPAAAPGNDEIDDLPDPPDPPPPPPSPAADDAPFWFGEYVNHCVDAIVDWAQWHISRAQARGITDTAALVAVIHAAADMACADEDGADDDTIDQLAEALHCAITAAKTAADMDQRRGDAETQHQAEEVETSYLRGWARRLVDVEICWRAARDKPKLATRFQLEAAHMLIFRGPSLVDHFAE